MDDKQLIIEAWKQIVVVQMHFNDLALRIRSFALTIIAAILAASGLGQSHSTPLVLVAPLVIWPAFYVMDRYWYHPLLLGAVSHGIAIEKHAKGSGLTLSGDDSAESADSLLGLAYRIKLASGKAMGLGSAKKMFLYYLILYIALWIIFLTQLFSR